MVSYRLLCDFEDGVILWILCYSFNVFGFLLNCSVLAQREAYKSSKQIAVKDLVLKNVGSINLTRFVHFSFRKGISSTYPAVSS